MSRRLDLDRRDAPALVLAWIRPWLPAARREWGEAMQAELASIETHSERWRFTAGCALAIVRRPAFGAVGSLAIPVGLVIATVLLTDRTAYLPLHIGLIVMVSALSALYLGAERLALFARPAGGSRLTSVVRAGGGLILAGLALSIVLGFRSGDGDVVDRAHSGVPILTVLIGLYLLGFIAMTSSALADTWAVAVGVGLGVSAAVVWLVAALARPPLPLSGVSALGALSLAVLMAAGIGARRGVAVLAALCTVVVGGLSLFVLTHLALAFGPASWVPSDSAALTPAARLAQSRTEAGEGYLGLILVGVLAATAVLVMALLRSPGSEDQPGRRWRAAGALPAERQ